MVLLTVFLTAVIVFSISFFVLHWQLLISASIAIIVAVGIAIVWVAVKRSINTSAIFGLFVAQILAVIVLFIGLFRFPAPPPLPPGTDYEGIFVDCTKDLNNSLSGGVIHFSAAVNLPGDVQWFEKNGRDFTVDNFENLSTHVASSPFAQLFFNSSSGRTQPGRAIRPGNYKYTISCKGGNVIDPMIQIPRPVGPVRWPTSWLSW